MSLDEEYECDLDISKGKKYPSVASSRSVKYKKFQIHKGPSTSNQHSIKRADIFDETSQRGQEISEPIHLNDATDCDILYLFLDLETSGFDPILRDISQISAMSNKHESEFFDLYLLQEGKISKEASKITGLCMKKGSLYLGKDPVFAVDSTIGLEGFVSYMQSLNQVHERIVLVGHRVVFDLQFLYHKLQRKGMWKRFTSTVSGVVDTLPMFRTYYKGRNKYTLTSLAEYFMGEKYCGHNALEDVKLLRNISGLLHEYFPKHTKDLKEKY